MRMLLVLVGMLGWGQTAAFVEEAKALKLPHLTVGVTSAEKTEWVSGEGRAQFRAGSITKVFTAIALMQLVEQGKVKLEDPLSQHLPELGYRGTLGQVMEHRAGIVREPGRGHYFDTKPATLREVTASLAPVKEVYEPGTVTKYSNAAVTLLGDVIERVSGEPYEDYVRRHILEPLGMKSSVMRMAEATGLVQGRMWTVDGREFDAPRFELGLRAAGNLITTAEDLMVFARWAMQADTRPVLRRETLDRMWKKGAGPFGIGFVVRPNSVGHTGAVYGHTAVLEIRPAQKKAVVAFAAKDCVEYALAPLARMALGDKYVAGQRPRFPQLESYTKMPAAYRSKEVGEYGWDFDKLYLLEHNGKLHCLIEWFFLAELEPLGQGEYRFPDGSIYAGERVVVKADGVMVGPVWFPRLPEPDRNFRIQMVKPLDEVKRIAEASTPPVPPAGLRAMELVDLRKMSRKMKFDIRYATANNFMGAPLYSRPGAYLQKPAAEALLKAEKVLNRQGYGLLIHDAYRPWRVTKMFWEATPVALRNFVANPATGSRHNRGCAVDLSLYDLRTGEPVEMPSGFDEFSDRAYPDYPGGTSRQRYLRGVLRRAMEGVGFTVNDDEWWHFDYWMWKQYPVGAIRFEQLESR